ncbi:nucleotidyltransferase domain-containing protein [Clostridium sp. AL.422]|uniref:nucleotidyltransferase domain-containing protein n=1 Tax=Clostridium TaxID=1485 RepID=UPI00293DA987|nr:MULTISPECIES: nucleotidyltransferase domain-containing protein [unclassified Clostridium]MDV4150672.1 nucleotidyltransferase domain-containing protein [Clostridium sp. AL.422]
MEISSILNSVVETFKNIKGIEAIVLGGSRATKTANEFSDIDIGIYYNEEFEIASFKEAATYLDDNNHKDCITNLGDWGPWINGGGWLSINNIAVDILFRDIRKVNSCIEDCKNGIITIDYQCGHPFGFMNSIYMGELYYCEILHSNSDEIQQMKNSLSIFPPTYKKASIEKFLWECEFSLACGKKAVNKNDTIYAAGSLFRSAVCLIYTLYSANEIYCINEKGSLSRLIKQKNVKLPINFKETMEEAMTISPNNLSEVFDKMYKLYDIISDMVSK